ncbi:hypothetical protein [Subtercola endophyticus]|uniref:hypothetical protein n=1 Tax=Subtercola endophyticus TaxID=2895559 RepID=UPI001E59AA43|nr:hypothetical protein [Subtercola endophyticus]UFS58942.1 hypothetical protein LQ955_18425 [Subtercola endophyticus]
MITAPPARFRALALAAATMAALAFCAATTTLPATPAHAEGAAAVRVAVAADPALVNTAYSDTVTALTVSGSGFQSIEKGFGGIYLLFGWVDPAGDWRPSAGGTTGSSYLYQVDDESKPAGYQQFISFPGGTTESQASGGDIAADGTWSTTLTVAGSSFEATDRDGNTTTVDCLTEQCGVITIGAHGVANANNETFTPVTFVSSTAAGGAADGAGAAGGAGATGGGAGAGAAGGSAGAADGSAGEASPDPTMTTLADPGAATTDPSGAGSAASPGDSTATPAITDASADAGSSSGAGGMIGSAIALAALLGVAIWRLLLWRRRADTPTPPSPPAS